MTDNYLFIAGLVLLAGVMAALFLYQVSPSSSRRRRGRRGLGKFNCACLNPWQSDVEGIASGTRQTVTPQFQKQYTADTLSLTHCAGFDAPQLVQSAQQTIADLAENDWQISSEVRSDARKSLQIAQSFCG
jgi:hypothetical protein